MKWPIANAPSRGFPTPLAPTRRHTRVITPRRKMKSVLDRRASPDPSSLKQTRATASLRYEALPTVRGRR